MREKDWLIPAASLTAASAASALLLIPDYSGIMPALLLLPLWMVATGAMAGVYSLGIIIRMMRAGVDSPLSHLCRLLAAERKQIIFVTLCMVLAGLNMIVFMWIKPLLNYLVPFWADPLLADIDHLLFFGHDPWRFLTWLNSAGLALFYHRGWFALMVLTLLLVLSKPASSEKSALMLSYFLLWSLVGPLIHMLLPAAGPIFFHNIGAGDRFSAIPLPDNIRTLADYLWTIYSGKRFGPASGISAMPSLHIATTVWMMIAVRVNA